MQSIHQKLISYVLIIQVKLLKPINKKLTIANNISITFRILNYPPLIDKKNEANKAPKISPEPANKIF